jgi:mRNA-degrading endonuclease RelE of RelBE toxin-antitoxin system
MKIIQSSLFERKVKKLNDHQKAQLDDAIRNILSDPSSGERKKGDLRMVFIYKFYIDRTLYLLAYSYTPELLELIMLGPHENYYAVLKRYLKRK